MEQESDVCRLVFLTKFRFECFSFIFGSLQQKAHWKLPASKCSFYINGVQRCAIHLFLPPILMHRGTPPRQSVDVSSRTNKDVWSFAPLCITFFFFLHTKLRCQSSTALPSSHHNSVLAVGPRFRNQMGRFPINVHFKEKNSTTTKKTIVKKTEIIWIIWNDNRVENFGVNCVNVQSQNFLLKVKSLCFLSMSGPHMACIHLFASASLGVVFFNVTSFFCLSCVYYTFLCLFCDKNDMQCHDDF